MGCFPGFVLGVDSATPRGGIALLSSGEVLAEINFDAVVSPSRRLLPSIRFALSMLNRSVEDIDAYAVTVGPGSFTGIRVGLSTAAVLPCCVSSHAWNWCRIGAAPRLRGWGAHQEPPWRSVTPSQVLVCNGLGRFRSVTPIRHTRSHAFQRQIRLGQELSATDRRVQPCPESASGRSSKPFFGRCCKLIYR